MRKSLLALLIAAAACGGKSNQNTTPPPTLPDDKPPVAETTPAEPEQPKEPPAPPVPQGPIEVSLPAPEVEVKLVNAGKGKKAKLALSPKAGTKQTTELALDFLGGQDGPPETGGKRDEVAPTVVLVADAEAQSVDDKGVTKFQFTVSGVDVKDKAGQKVSSAEFKSELQTLVGSTIGGTVDKNGKLSEVKLRIEKPDAKSEGALEFVKLSLLPMWPVLPTEAIGPGAKWTVTSKQKVADQLEIKKVVSYELVGKKGTAWTIKGTTKVTGEDQSVEAVPGAPPAKLGNIGGGGNHEVTMTDGALVPAIKQNLATDFTISLQAPPKDGTPPGAPIVIKFHVEQANALTPKS